MADNQVVQAGNVGAFGDTHMVMMGRVSNQHIQLDEASIVGGVPMVEIGTMDIKKAISQIGRDNENTGLISMDGLFCPYIINGNGSSHATLPSWSTPTDTGSITASQLNPFNPDHVFSTGLGHFNTSVFYESGHNIAYQNRFSSVGSGTTGDLSQYKELYNNGTSNMDRIRAVGFKAPVVFTGWGYDISNNPVPADPAHTGQFAPNAFRDPSLWKSGPFDMRWNESKGMWTAGNGSTEIMRFTVDGPSTSMGDTSAGCNYVLTTVTDVGDTTTSVTIGETGVRVFDEDLCFFNLPISVITGLKGTAHGFRNIYANAVDSGCVGSSVISSSLRWVVIGLCCGEEVING